MHLLRGEPGSSLLELAMVLPLFMLLLLGGIDFGRAYYLSMEIAGAAQAAAMYGAMTPSNLTDTTGMANAAQSDAPNVPGITAQSISASYGCECATDTTGSTYSASCATTPTCTGNNEVYLVNVSVSATYKPLFPWPKIPSSMPFSASASMRCE